VDERQFGDFARLAAPLLVALEGLIEIARDLYPTPLSVMLEAIGRRDEALAAARPDLSDWPGDMTELADLLNEACDQTLGAYAALRAADPDDRMQVFRALRGLTRAEEALYPFSWGAKAISRFYLPAHRRNDEALIRKIATAPDRKGVGIIHIGDPPGARGGTSLYVPEYYSEDRAWPLVVALHGGRGNSRSFLWNWLRDARGEGVLLAALTSLEDTWSISGPDIDGPRLPSVVAMMSENYRVDPARILLTGMSDGGTYSYVAGLEPGSPFTHLAPVAAAFHPMLAAMADPNRLAGLPIHIAHGALDWMFPVEMAREAQAALKAAGAAVTYREIDDLSHTYPRELNPEILAWLDRTASGRT